MELIAYFCILFCTPLKICDLVIPFYFYRFNFFFMSNFFYDSARAQFMLEFKWFLVKEEKQAHFYLFFYDSLVDFLNRSLRSDIKFSCRMAFSATGFS